MLLKSAIYGRDSGVLEQVQFADISIGQEIAMSDFEPQISGEGYTWYTSSKPGSVDHIKSTNSSALGCRLVTQRF